MDRLKPEARPKVTRLSAQELHECPGGPHEPVQAAIAEVLGEMGLANRAIGVAPVGCALLLFESLDIDCITVPPGRGAAVAAGIKRVHPTAVVFSFQGGWDASCAGVGEILHAAQRGEPITIVHTDLARGPRAPRLAMAELVAAVEGPAFVERLALGGEHDLPALRSTLARAFAVQRDRAGFGFVEVVPRDSGASARRTGCLKEPAAR